MIPNPPQPNSWEDKTKIEIAYPEAYRLARKFHEMYEEFAPKFGYGTRGDTKEFDPESPNGRLMAYVCYHIVEEEIEKAVDFALSTQASELIEKLEWMKKERKIPWQALQFGDCPKCGAEVNQKWVDMKVKEIADQALDEAISTIKRKE